MDFKTNYPYVFVHGMFGYGPGSKLYDYAPYFGLLGGKITDYFCDHGIEAYDAAVGPYSSAWDRACELYAQLTGTRVDYGEAHSKRYGHARFGRKYEKPIIDNWGGKDQNGQTKRINLFGHSFGGTTSRLLATLLAYGCEAEKQDAVDDISPLFTGGKADWIYSITTYSTPHNGMTLFDDFGDNEKYIRSFIYNVAALTNNTPVAKFYDFKLDQFGLTTEPFSTERSEFNRNNVEKVIESEDNIFHDLSVMGSKTVNSHLKCVPSIYYFSYTDCRTHAIVGGNHMPNRNMFVLLKISAPIIGSYRLLKNIKAEDTLDSQWLANDGIINTVSGLAPDNEPATDFNLVETVRPGIWYKMGTMDMDHLTFCGSGISHKEISEFYFNHAVGINNLG